MKQKKFEREIKSLVYYLREYGIQHVNVNLDDVQRNPQRFSDFIISVHNGFSIAQKIVIENLTSILVEKREAKQALKDANRNKDKEQQAHLSEKVKMLEYQEFTFRKIVDSMAWHFVGFDISSIRRLYLGHNVIDITDSNLESCIRTAETLTNESQGNFALISDLSSFIQVGDLLLINPEEGIKLIELKEGKENEKIGNIIDEYSKNKCARYLYLALENQNPKFKDQFSRYTNQIKTGIEVANVINTGKGVDPSTGINLSIAQNEIELDTFEDVVCDLLRKCSIKGYAISVIDECLLLGVYETSKFSSRAFDIWVNGVKIKTPIFDLRQSIFDPLGFPFFLHNFSANDIINIISGRKVVKMTIDVDVWLKPLTNEGFTYRWMSPKETSRFHQTNRTHKMLAQIEGKGIVVSKDDYSYYIGGGLFTRMFHMFSKPSSILEYIKETYEHSIRHKEEK